MSNECRLSSGGRPSLSPQQKPPPQPNIILKRAGGERREAQVERADAIGIVVNLTKKAKTNVASGGGGGRERAPSGRGVAPIKRNGLEGFQQIFSFLILLTCQLMMPF